MKAMKYVFIFVIIAIICGLLFVMNNTCSGYTCLSFENKSAFQEVERIEGTTESYRGVLEKGDVRIRLEAYTSSSKMVADQFTQAKIMQLLGLYEEARSPYPGALSNEIVCEERFKPTIKETVIEGANRTTITGFLNDRLQYGSCMENQLPYIGKTVMLYCPDQKKWYYFEAITKRNDLRLESEINHLIQSLKCKRSF